MQDGATLLEKTNNAQGEHRREKSTVVADQLEQSNRGLRQQRDQAWLREILIGCAQVVQRNRKVMQAATASGTMGNDLVQQNVMQHGSGENVDQLALAAVQYGAVGAMAANLSLRQNNPYAANVIGVSREVPLVSRSQQVPPDYDGAHYFTSRHSVGAQNAVVRHVAPDGTHVYRQ